MAMFPKVQNPCRNLNRPALAAAMVAAALALPATPVAADPIEKLIVLGGAIADPAHTECVEDESDGTIPQLPIVYEDNSGD